MPSAPDGLYAVARLAGVTLSAETRKLGARTDLTEEEQVRLNHLIVLDEHHLLSVLREYVTYYNQDRPHRTLGLQPPEPRPRLTTGPIRSRPVLNGLHHVYERAA